jgi:hypothetical protein
LSFGRELFAKRECTFLVVINAALIRFLVAIKDFGWLSIRAVGRGVGGL